MFVSIFSTWHSTTKSAFESSFSDYLIWSYLISTQLRTNCTAV